MCNNYHNFLQGLENFIARHQECAKLLQDGLEKIGFKIFVEDEVSFI